jgi:hypothetical protein
METPHGHYLTITRAGSTSYFLVYPATPPKPSLSLIPSDEFTQVATLRMPARVKAMPYVYGRDTTLERVFSVPGKYLLQVGDNIGTDSGTPPASCNLTFLGAASK